VDCLLGTGFQGTLKEPYRSAVNEINGSGSYVISVDINSGMNGDTGFCELAVKSHLTVTIGYVKTGLISENAGKYMDRLVCADIGIILSKEEGKILDADVVFIG
jgi:NAD(P)H-hydrate epimerase